MNTIGSYTISGSESAIARRNVLIEICNEKEKNNKNYCKKYGVIVGKYNTFIPKGILDEYKSAELNLNKIYKKSERDINRYNESLKIIVDITCKRIVAERANRLLMEYKKQKQQHQLNQQLD